MTPDTDPIPTEAEFDFVRQRLYHLESELGELSHSAFSTIFARIGLGCVMAFPALILLAASPPMFLAMVAIYCGFRLSQKPVSKRREADRLREILYDFSQIPIQTSEHANIALKCLNLIPTNLSEDLRWMCNREIKRVLETIAEANGAIRLNRASREWLWEYCQKTWTPLEPLHPRENRKEINLLGVKALAACGTEGDYRLYLRLLNKVRSFHRTGENWETYLTLKAQWRTRLDAEETQATLLRAGSVPQDNLLRPHLKPPQEDEKVLLRSVGEENSE